MLYQGIILIILTFLAKIAGFLRDLAISYFYGASSVVDAYVIATTIPMVIFSFVGTGIETSLIPMLSKVEAEGENENIFVSNIINISVALCVAAIIVVLCFPTPIIRLFASGFDGESMRMAVAFTRFSIVGIIFSTLTYIYASILHYRNKFIAAAFSTLLMDAIVIVFVFLSSRWGTFFLPVGNVAALFLQALFLRIFTKYRHKLVFNLRDKYSHEMIIIIVPVIIGTSINQINLLVDQTLASRILVGGISYLNYANRVLGVVLGVFILSFISLIFPKITKMLSANLMDELFKHVENWIVLLQFILFPCTMIFCLYSNEIIALLFQHGKFNSTDTAYTAAILCCYAIELPFYGIREIISRVYYAQKNTKLPMYNATFGLVIKVSSSILLSLKFGLVALPIGTTIACICTAIFIVIQFRKDFLVNQMAVLLTRTTKWSLWFLLSSMILLLIKNSSLVEREYGFIMHILLFMLIYNTLNIPLLIKKKMFDNI